MELNRIDRSLMASQIPNECPTSKVPNLDRAVFGAADNVSFVEADIRDASRMTLCRKDQFSDLSYMRIVYYLESPYLLKMVHAPDDHGCVRRAGNHDMVVVFQTEHAAPMSFQRSPTLVR